MPFPREAPTVLVKIAAGTVTGLLVAGVIALVSIGNRLAAIEVRMTQLEGEVHSISHLSVGPPTTGQVSRLSLSHLAGVPQ